jgi:antitoxin MazE
MYIRRRGVKFAKWGNSLAIRIPAEVVAELGLSANDEAEIKVTGKHSFEISRDLRREEALEAMKRLSFPLPPGYRFNREEINERDWVRRLDGNPEQEKQPEQELQPEPQTEEQPAR